MECKLSITANAGNNESIMAVNTNGEIAPSKIKAVGNRGIVVTANDG